MPLVDKVDRMTPGQILADTNVADFIAELGLGIARAQAKLDRNAVKQLIKMARETPEGMEASGKSLLDLGLVPAFYHFQYADLEVSLNVTMTVDRTTTTTVDIGVDVEDLDNFEEREGNTDTLTVEVKQSEATRAQAILDLEDNTQDCSVTVRFNGTDSSIAVPADAPRGAGIGQTAQNLADALQALATVQTAEVDLLPGAGNVTLTENSDAMEVTGNEVTLLEDAASPAVHYAALRSASADTLTVGWDADTTDNTAATDTTYDFVGTGATGNQVDIDSKSDNVVLQELAGLIDGNAADYSATFIAQQGRLVRFPRPAEHSELPDPRPSAPNQTRQGYINATTIDYTPLTVEFALDDTTCKPGVRNNQRALDEIVQFLGANPSWTVRLEGHADINGDSTATGKAHNMSLSKDRAQAVKNALIDRGIDDARITTQGFGATQQICIYDNSSPNETPTIRKERDWINRRVEFRLIKSGADPYLHPIMKLEADAGGDNRITLDGAATGLESLGARDGHAVLEIDGDTLTVVVGSGTHTFTEGAEFNKGATPAASAQSLATAINDAGQADMSASARGATVIVGGSGSVAVITLTSARLGPSGNDTGLSATGALTVRKGFHGGKGGVLPTNGSTVDLGGKTLTLVTDPDEALEDREFRSGKDAAETASNLATAINGLSGFSASAGGPVVTVTGPSGVSVSTSDKAVFDLSEARFGGPVKMKTVEDKTAVAVHTNISVTDARKYGLEVTGNSTIKARLVSLPVPVELLDEVKAYFND